MENLKPDEYQMEKLSSKILSYATLNKL